MRICKNLDLGPAPGSERLHERRYRAALCPRPASTHPAAQAALGAAREEALQKMLLGRRFCVFI